ncbi:pyridoxal-phosphate dependent enzyme [Kitasatospora sp. NPDC051853]|uniref:threonine synthase n=1 Tax=Kitasatospora sp. NPDC051853 TaxID=3364058 RepID=UPI0037982161
MTAAPSLATSQVSLGDPEVRYPLWPALTAGCPATSTPETAYPVEVDYDYAAVPAGLFEQQPGPGLDRWAPLLPPLDAPTLGEGGTPLLALPDSTLVKDESRNPTWSHKDRLNRVTVSAAVHQGAGGIVVASSGNHGASAAAYAARAGLRCVVLASASSPPAVQSFLNAYGAVVLPVPAEARWPLLRLIAERTGLHPVSNHTRTHTGHGFGAEGYKTVAYELHAEVGTPAAVFVPTGYGELLYGVWKGFAELYRLGVAARVPRVFSCEPAVGGPLAAAVRTGTPAAVVEVGPTEAYAIDVTNGGHRGVRAVTASGGAPLLLTDREVRAAQGELAAQGMWTEFSSAIGLAGLRQLGGPAAFDGPVVCVSTSSGFKDLRVGTERAEALDPDWAVVAGRLKAAGIEV